MSANSIAEKFEVIADAVYEKGKEDENDRFWDDIQQKGNRNNYQACFMQWGAKTITPKYKIRTGTLYQLIAYCKELEYVVWDMIECTSDSFASAYNFAINCSKLKSIDMDINVSKATTTSGMTGAFQDCTELERIQKIITSANIQYNTTFKNCNSLKEIEFDGIIGQSIDFQHSPLNRASLENIVEHLSPTSTGQIVTFKKTAVGAAFDTTGNSDGYESAVWELIVASKSNWTISLV